MRPPHLRARGGLDVFCRAATSRMELVALVLEATSTAYNMLLAEVCGERVA